MTTPEQSPKPEETRVIKRYSNRKLYDTHDSRYVTLQQIGEMVRRGEEVQIIDNKTKEDKTEVTLALILSEDLKNKPSSVPLSALRHLIQERGEKIIHQLREGPFGRLLPRDEDDPDAAEGAVGEATSTAAEPTEGAAAATDEAADGDNKTTAKARLNELVETSRHTIDQWQAAVDERVMKALPGASLLRDLRTDLQALSARIAVIEEQLGITPPSPASAEVDDAES